MTNAPMTKCPNDQPQQLSYIVVIKPQGLIFIKTLKTENDEKIFFDVLYPVGNYSS